MNFRNLKKGDLDVFIISSTFFTGIFLNLLSLSAPCELCEVAFALAVLSWFFTTAFSILYRIHHRKINRIIVVSTHLLMRLSVLITIGSVNLFFWTLHYYLFFISIGFTALGLVVYLIDLIQFKRKEAMRAT